MGENTERDDTTAARLAEHQRLAGQAGGRARTEAKRAASKANLAKARVNRWKGREAAAAAALTPSNGDLTPSNGANSPFPDADKEAAYQKWLSEPVAEGEGIKLLNAFNEWWNRKGRLEEV